MADTPEPVTVKLPNQLTVSELIAAGKTAEQATHIMHQRVFGHDYKMDAAGNPVEQGKGSAAQPTSQHVQALKKAEDRARAAKPVDVVALIKEISASQTQLSPEVIANIVQAAVTAALAAPRANPVETEGFVEG